MYFLLKWTPQHTNAKNVSTFEFDGMLKTILK